jgi:hypothetical protein
MVLAGGAGVGGNNDAYRRQTVEAQSLSAVFVGARQAPEQFSDVVLPELDCRLGRSAEATLGRGRCAVGHQQPHHLVVALARRCREHENDCGQAARHTASVVRGWVP